MKYFLATCLLLLTGCFHYTWNSSQPPKMDKPDWNPTQIARGTDGINSWACTDVDVNSNLVWIECKFHNNWPAIAGNSVATSCVRVRFFDEHSDKLVVESRKVCSGPLKVGQESTNYAAFIKKDRDTLRKCGEMLDLCVMLAGNDNP